MTCASEILPGPTIIIINTDASKIKSISNPLSPVRFCAPLTWKIAPNMMMDSSTAENLLSTPIINNIPETDSASAIGICISAGIPRLPKKFTNPGLNFPTP